MLNHQDPSRQKKQFYDDLEALCADDERPDPGRKASERAWRRSKTPAASIADARVVQSTLAHAVSDSTVEANSEAPAQDPFAKPAAPDPGKKPPLNKTRVASLTKSKSDLSSSSMSKKAIGKRKRDNVAGLVPEEQQLFRTLQFYFFPNNKSNLARRMRISKAQQYGAIWHQDWTDQVTHVIVDKGITFEELLKFLKMDTLPETVIVVSEDYPAECLSYRALLNPSSFRIDRLMTALRTEPTDSKHSPRLKPACRIPVQQRNDTHSDKTKFFGSATGVRSNCSSLKEVQNHSEETTKSFQMYSINTSREFDEAVQKARALKHVPIDDEMSDCRPNTSEGLDSDDADETAGQKLLNQRKGKLRTVHDKFLCMQKHTGNESGNPNQPTIDILQQMADYYGQTGDGWRARGYRKAISTLRVQTTKICSREEAAALPNIGGRLAEKIEEIAATSRLRRLENAKADSTNTILQTFMGVYGAGLVTATQWVDQGYKTLDELLQKAELTHNQRIGITHYADFNSRIPREEVECHANVVRGALQDIDPSFRVIIGGSFRRGAKDCSDIDCIITRPDTGANQLRDIMLGQLVPQLQKRGFLVARLASTSREDGSKWHGASCLPNSTTWRRLDLLLVPSDEFGAALIYFTGNDIFNRSLRLLASTKGMRLNQRGLYRDVLRTSKREKVTEGTLVESRDEKKIFEALGVPWRPPEHRVC